MNRRIAAVCLAAAFIILLVCSTAILAAQLVKAKDGSGIFGYKDTPILPWCGYHVHDPDRPAPPVVTTAADAAPPSDAIVLFDGADLSQWQPSDWKIDNGRLIAVSGHLRTKQSFADCQLYLEWQTPNPPVGDWMDRGNNGVLLMGLFEIQIYDSYQTLLYPDGQAASIYGQTPPLVNACRPPGQWQSFNIIFYAPVFKDGKLQTPARTTIIHNGVLVHHNETIHGRTTHRNLPRYTESMQQPAPVSLMSHNNPVRFRNIWIRPLN